MISRKPRTPITPPKGRTGATKKASDITRLKTLIHMLIAQVERLEHAIARLEALPAPPDSSVVGAHSRPPSTDPTGESPPT